MKLLTVALSVMLAFGAVSQQATAQRTQNPETYYRAPSSLHGKTVVIPAGTTFEGRMDRTIGSSVSQAGQRFTITMASPVLANGVDVIIPAGTHIIGEVVEAIPASDFPQQKNQPKPNGRLRVQITGLQTPDGMSYPLVASITGETIVMGRKVIANPALGGGIGYMGTSAGFEAVAPGANDRYRGRGGRPPMVMRPQEMMRDPIYGAQSRMNSLSRSGMAAPTIRSLVRREHDLYIDAGSPISISLDAPFKIGVNPTGTAGEALPELNAGESSSFNEPQSSENSGRHFRRSDSQAQRKTQPMPEPYPVDSGVDNKDQGSSNAPPYEGPPSPKEQRQQPVPDGSF